MGVFLGAVVKILLLSVFLFFTINSSNIVKDDGYILDCVEYSLSEFYNIDFSNNLKDIPVVTSYFILKKYGIVALIGGLKSSDEEYYLFYGLSCDKNRNILYIDKSGENIEHCWISDRSAQR